MRISLGKDKFKCRPIFGGFLIGVWLLLWCITEMAGFDSVNWLIGVEMTNAGK